MSEVRQVMGFLSGVPLPADKRSLVEYAKKRGAPQDIVDVLEKVPDGRFSDLNDVWLAVGGVA